MTHGRLLFLLASAIGIIGIYCGGVGFIQDGGSGNVAEAVIPSQPLTILACKNITDCQAHPECECSGEGIRS